MKILLDTHIAIWSVLDSEELSDRARKIILDEDNEIYYSAASVWEITIKHMAHPEGMRFMTHDALLPYYSESFIIDV